MEKRKLSQSEKDEIYNVIVPIAENFRNEYLNNEEPIKDTFETLEQLGYFIICFPAHDDLPGYYGKNGKLKCVFVNSSHSLGRQYFSAWHEVYHAYTGHSGRICLYSETEYDEMEQCADFFASCILLPEHLVREYLIKNRLTNLRFISHINLIKMQNHFRVSYSTLITRLVQLFPSYKTELSRRIGLGEKSRNEELIKKTIEANCDVSLNEATNKFSISQKFYEKLYSNIEKDIISVEKAQSILNFLEEIKKEYEK